MLRRSFRFGLTLGLLAGIAYALVRAVQSQREPAVAAPPRPWPPLEPETPRSTPVAPGSHGARSTTPAPPPQGPRPAAGPPATATPSPSAPPTPRAPAAPADRTATPAGTPPAPAAERVGSAASSPSPAPSPPAPAAAAASEAATRAVGRTAAKKAAKATKKSGKKAAKKATKAAKAQRSWVEPADGTCPTSHPVKAKLASKIFHLPGMLNYERTKPDRCYADADAATSDGLRPAKR